MGSGRVCGGLVLTPERKRASLPNAVCTKGTANNIRENRHVIDRASSRGNYNRLDLRLRMGHARERAMLNHKDLTASIAFTIAETAIATCKANGYKVSVTVVGRNGEIILQVRGDDSNPHTMENSMRKAYTARTTRSPSGALVDRLKADPTLAFVHLTNIIAFQGALPITVGDDVIGAAGASGAPGGEKDEACVKAGIDKVADQLK